MITPDELSKTLEEIFPAEVKILGSDRIGKITHATCERTAIEDEFHSPQAPGYADYWEIINTLSQVGLLITAIWQLRPSKPSREDVLGRLRSSNIANRLSDKQKAKLADLLSK